MNLHRSETIVATFAITTVTLAICVWSAKLAAPTFHVERIDADGVACVAVKTGASVALSCNWPAAAPQWWQPQPEEPKP